MGCFKFQVPSPSQSIYHKSIMQGECAKVLISFMNKKSNMNFLFYAAHLPSLYNGKSVKKMPLHFVKISNTSKGKYLLL